MSIHVCTCEHHGNEEFHLRYPGMDENAAQSIADRINGGALDVSLDCNCEHRRKYMQSEYRAQIARLREALNDIASPNSNHEIFTNAPAGMTLDRMYEEIAQAALSETSDAQELVDGRAQWHSMRDKMPEEDGYYLVLNNNCVVKNKTVPIVMHWIGATKGWYSHQLTIMYSGVTHWMPLPPAPDKQGTQK